MKLRSLLFLSLLAAISFRLQASTVVVPGIANAPGANGTSFQSDLDIINPASTATTATLHFIGYPGSAPQADRAFTINAGESFLLVNVLQSVWNLTNSGGAVVVTSPSHLVVTAKTYNNAAAGTYGNALPVIDSDLLLVAGERGISPWLSQSSDLTRGFRTNIGLVFPDAAGGSATVTAFDAGGAILGSQKFDVSSPTFTQVPASSFTNTTSEIGRINIDVTRGLAAGYTSVVDNVTGDGSVFPTDRVLDGPTDVVLSGIGRTPGANDTYWRSDIRLVNPGNALLTVEAAYLKPLVDNTAATPVSIVLMPGETREIIDVLDFLFGASNGSSGALRLTSPRGLPAAGRTSNLDATRMRAGSYGSQQLPVSFSTFADGTSEATIPQIAQSAVFRTNIGLVSAASGATYRLRLLKGDGTELSSYSGSLPPYSWSQSTVASLFPGVAIPDNSRVSVLATGGSLNAYGSSIDQRSGDPIVTSIDLPRCSGDIAINVAATACPGRRQTATASRYADALYQWTIAGGSIDQGQGTESLTFIPDSVTPVTLGLTIARGCIAHVSRALAIDQAAVVGSVTVSSSSADAPVTIDWSMSASAPVKITGTDFPVAINLDPQTRRYIYTPTSIGAKSVAVTALSACGNSSVSSATYTVVGSVGTLGPGSGGSGGAYPGLQTIHAASGRDYVVYVPVKYNPSQPAYLVFAWGGQGEPASWVLQFGWQGLADRDGIIVVTMTPSSSGPNYTGAYDRPEFDTIVEAERDVPKRYNVAVNHISFWGFSAGAHVTYWLALQAERSNRLNAFAIQAGAIEAAATTLSPVSWPPQPGARRLPIYISCGTADIQGSGGGLIGALRRNADMLTAEKYPVLTHEVTGMTHTYTSQDVYRAWDFLKVQELKIAN
ncbi:MAG TPA: hypothetical protein VHL58_10480 [Thermoanaerobaculia bacterium]|nr:hypothetical protein [Thermoanaerobaculia bacterium]